MFTTHTPVPAGNDSYPAEQVRRRSAAWRELGVRRWMRCRARPTRSRGRADEPFGVTQAALRLSRAANGVSRRHGEVAREMWTALWPERAADEVPIGHVTNGVHVPTWIGDADARAARPPPRRGLGGARGRSRRPGRRSTGFPDAELWEVRRRQRTELVAFVRERSTADRLARGDVREYVEAAARGVRLRTC